MEENHSSTPRSRLWRRWIPRTAAAGAGGTALLLWLEEIILIATEFIGVIFLTIVAGILYLFNLIVFRTAIPPKKDHNK